LEGESLVNDTSVLIMYRYGVAAVTGGSGNDTILHNRKDLAD
jgi:NhaP-type Na+/H+ or K+/H+ antiporter